MTLKEKVLACKGHVNIKSAAKMCNTYYAYVNVVWNRAGYIPSNNIPRKRYFSNKERFIHTNGEVKDKVS